MPKRTDLKTILLIGSGPIVIGQGAEFDYSGTQAVRALKEEGYRVVLVNSNPATIMTDPELADATYIEPVTPEWVAKVIERERPDALLPTMGGQTALNVAMALQRDGTLAKYGVELIGANERAIRLAEDREEFAQAMQRIGLATPPGRTVRSLEEALEAVEATGYPAILRPSFTLGGTGGGIAYNLEEFETLVRRGLELSPVGSVLVERSVIGWKEFELEVMRDGADNVVIVCSIENLDPMGVHTGDSITVAPAMTLTDREYQVMRDASIRIIREIGVEAGGCNIQFAVDPATGEQLVIEMNPRVSRSSALASKATGFPIARIGTKVAVGYTLDELPNDITRVTPGVVRAGARLRRRQDPALRLREVPGRGPDAHDPDEVGGRGDGDRPHVQGGVPEGASRARDRPARLGARLHSGRRPAAGRVAGDRAGGAPDAHAGARLPDQARPPARRLGRGDRGALAHRSVVPASDGGAGRGGGGVAGGRAGGRAVRRSGGQGGQAAEEAAEHDERRAALRKMKRLGFSDRQLADLSGVQESEIRAERHRLGLRPAYKTVDTCAGEFPSSTPYLYSSYDEENEARASGDRTIVILGSGPNRIGQGVEFDYCCVRAAMSFRELGYRTVMVNSNPETVSTDFDISDALYFEPLTLEDVLEIVHVEQPIGVVVQLGGQTPLRLARGLEREGVPILGTSPEAIDLAEDRGRFEAITRELGVAQPPSGVAFSIEEAVAVAARVGYPVLVRPSYVLGGRAMEICYDDVSLRSYFARAARVAPEHPVLIDSFLEDAFEADVDAISDGTRCVIGGVMQHIEDAGIHSGDSACVLPPYLITEAQVEEMRRHTRAFAERLGVVGLLNVQYAIKGGIVYVLEVNPRGSRTIPFVSKTTGVALASLAAAIMTGATLDDLGLHDDVLQPYVAVKEAVFPFSKLQGVDLILGPEMRSTGEVMGIADSFGMAFAKAQISVDGALPLSGSIFVTVNDHDKANVVPIVRRFHGLGFRVFATEGTARYLRARGVPAERVLKVHEGRPNAIDLLVSGQIQLLINTPLGKLSQQDDYAIRQAALQHRVPYTTTLSGASAASDAIIALKSRAGEVRPLQEWHALAREMSPEWTG